MRYHPEEDPKTPSLVLVESLEQLVLESHVVFRLKTNTGAEDVDESISLLAQCVDDRCARRSKRCLV